MWPSASDPLKAVVVSELFVLSLALSWPISMPPVSSYVGIKFFVCVSCSFVASGHSMGFICSTVLLMLFAEFPKQSLMVKVFDHYFCHDILSCAEHFT